MHFLTEQDSQSKGMSHQGSDAGEINTDQLSVWGRSEQKRQRKDRSRDVLCRIKVRGVCRVRTFACSSIICVNRRCQGLAQQPRGLTTPLVDHLFIYIFISNSGKSSAVGIQRVPVLFPHIWPKQYDLQDILCSCPCWNGTRGSSAFN